MTFLLEPTTPSPSAHTSQQLVGLITLSSMQQSSGVWHCRSFLMIKLTSSSTSANAFALFLKSQRKWTSKPLDEEHITLFKQRMAKFEYSPDQVLPHGSYLINLANPDPYVPFFTLFHLCDELTSSACPERNERNLTNASWTISNGASSLV